MTKARVNFARSVQALCIALLIGAGVASGCGKSTNGEACAVDGDCTSTQRCCKGFTSELTCVEVGADATAVCPVACQTDGGCS